MKTKAGFMDVTCSLRIGLVVAVAVFLQHNATAQITIPYGDAASFSILAGTEITNSGAGTSIGQNVGLSPAAGTFYAGFNPLVPGQVGGTIYAVDSSGPAGVAGNNPGLLTDAISDFHATYLAAGSQTPNPVHLGLQLGTQTLVPGVYTFDAGTVLLTSGTLTLNGNGVANPMWIFQVTSDLTTSAGGSILLENGATPCDILWRVPTQATLGEGSTFDGTIMAHTAIVMGTGATLYGRAWADAQVTLLDDTITGLPCTSLGGGEGGGTSVPDSGTTLLLLGSGLAALLGFGRRLRSLV
jgi:hypothetical protein